MDPDPWRLRLATSQDATAVAALLHAFNAEFATPSPGIPVLADRLRLLLGRDSTFAVLAGVPPIAVALVTLRSNVWYAGPVALLDEMYVAPDRRGSCIGSAVLERVLQVVRERGAGLVEINVDEGDEDAQRFYRRHGFASTEPGSSERAFYFWRDPA